MTDEIIRTLDRLESGGLKIGPRSHAGKALAALRRSLDLDRDSMLMNARGSLIVALKGNDEDAVADAVVTLSALSRDRQHFADEIARVRRTLTDELKNTVLPSAFSYAVEAYNSAGANLMDALGKCDATATADSVNAMSPEAVRAWGALSEMNADCDRAAGMLRDVLSITGSRINMRRPDAFAPLFLTGGDEERIREVFAWQPIDPAAPNAPKASTLDKLMSSRAGRWGTLHLYTGAEVRCTLDEPGDYSARVKARNEAVKAEQQAAAAKAADDERKVVGTHVT